MQDWSDHNMRAASETPLTPKRAFQALLAVVALIAVLIGGSTALRHASSTYAPDGIQLTGRARARRETCENRWIYERRDIKAAAKAAGLTHDDYINDCISELEGQTP